MSDRTILPHVTKVIGSRINCFPSYRSLYDFVLKDLTEKQQRGYIMVNNVHTIMESYWNPQFRRYIEESYLSIPDGKPLQVVGHFKKAPGISRLFGPTVLENFLDWGRKDRVRHFLFGGSPDTLKAMQDQISAKYPGAEIVGTVSPPYGAISHWPNDKYIQEINESKPDMIWVGLGAPKQETWMNQFSGQIDKGILIGIGAGFSYMAGNTKHAPDWMKNASLEWLYRLKQEPRRLFKRYFLTIPPFLLLATLDIISHKVSRGKRY